MVIDTIREYGSDGPTVSRLYVNPLPVQGNQSTLVGILRSPDFVIDKYVTYKKDKRMRSDAPLTNLTRYYSRLDHPITIEYLDGRWSFCPIAS